MGRADSDLARDLLRKKRGEFSQRVLVEQRAVADAGDTEPGQLSDRRRRGKGEDVHGRLERVDERSHDVGFLQEDRVEAVVTGRQVGAPSRNRVVQELDLGPSAAATGKKHVDPRVDEGGYWRSDAA